VTRRSTEDGVGSRPLAANDRNDHVVVAPERARIASLIARRTGRDWLAEGEAPLLEEPHARYGLAEASGSISPCVIAGPPLAGRLRDHRMPSFGDAAGRSARLANGAY
jgi:hypothetical protein